MPDGHLRRMACQIAAQLPDDREECLRVLRYVEDIVTHLGRGWGTDEGPLKRSASLYVFERTSPAGAGEAAMAGQNGRLDTANLE